ncbi:hypothetical protein evm_000316 [Chilo suppressalis]|nr:hypothetical protein evm_000316 [Chilo suppressalis]
MYIAFKWLAGLTLAMWIAMCIIDVYIKHSKEIARKEIDILHLNYRNISITPQSAQNNEIQRKSEYHKHYDTTVLHYIMFFAGALAVSVFNKKSEIISYTKNSIAKIDIKRVITVMRRNINKAATLLGVALTKNCKLIWEILLFYINKIQNKCRFDSCILTNNKLSNILLLNKIKEFAEEKKQLGQQLKEALQENRKIKQQYQLEIMAKNRLVRHKEDIKQKVKENQSKYVNFQHLYLVTHQENVFLKSRVRQLTNDKENVEKDLRAIVNQVYKSKNNDLIAYCSKFITRPRKHFVNTNINEEVRKFLEKSRIALDVTTEQLKVNKNVKVWSTQVAMKNTGSYSDENMLHLISDAPRLKGLPGECIWTVKDKDGIIEKLYEYDFDSGLDNGDTIHRIREYSVYHDKDCLLDFSSSRRIITEDYNTIKLRRVYPSNQKFLTGSEAFQKFLQNNRNMVAASKSPTTRSLHCI